MTRGLELKSAAKMGYVVLTAYQLTNWNQLHCLKEVVTRHGTFYKVKSGS